MPKEERLRWHPLLATIEPEPGVWLLMSANRRPYGLVQIVKIPRSPSAPEMIRFRAEHAGAPIGYATTLREAVERIHAAETAVQHPRGEGAPPPTTWDEWMLDSARPMGRDLWIAKMRKRYGRDVIPD